jgi:HSP20 family protein
MNNEEISIENRLRDLRKKNNLSQEELAEELGISRQSVIALEQGKYLPSLPLVVNMCKFFHSPFEEIFEFQREIEEEISQAFEENKLINIADGPIRLLSQNIEPDRSGLVRDKENIVANEMEPWRPFREMISLRDAMDRLFEDSVITPKTVSAMPKLDIKDKKDSIVVKAELPGMTEEEVDIEISDGVMTISGEKKEEKEKEEEGYYYKESHSGAFSRSFTLPADVVAEKAEADMKDGVLSIIIPKVEPKKATKVKVAAKKK